MIRCPSCNSPVNVTMPVKLISGIGITPSGIRLNSGRLISIGSDKPVYFCVNCKKDVDLEKLSVNCDKCFSDNSLDNLYISEGVGGIYCKDCVSPNSKSYQLSKILGKFAG